MIYPIHKTHRKKKKLTTFYELSYTSNIYVSDVFCETKKPTAKPDIQSKQLKHIDI